MNCLLIIPLLIRDIMKKSINELKDVHIQFTCDYVFDGMEDGLIELAIYSYETLGRFADQSYAQRLSSNYY